MKPDSTLYLVAVIFAVVAFMMVRRFTRFGGFRGAMFGAEIRRTLGEVSGASGSMVRIVVRVHALGGAPDRAVGIELTATSFASYRMVPAALSIADTNGLIGLLQAATREQEGAT